MKKYGWILWMAITIALLDVVIWEVWKFIEWSILSFRISAFIFDVVVVFGWKFVRDVVFALRASDGSGSDEGY